ncbi:MAG TPA: DciA family protein [Blastocatellia bacterium]|jgi:predicted nucleic acid-binding Zn ribbon protein|nr:DciA family protein [Blastocatellia bacterium]
MMKDLLRLLPVLLRQAGDSDEAREQAAFAAWAGAVGEQIRRVTAPMKLERKTLLVAVHDQTWKNELERFKGQALFKLNSLLGAPGVTAIEFIVNREFVERNTPQAPSITFIAPEQQALPLRSNADRISQPEIRAAFLRAAGKCLERRAR